MYDFNSYTITLWPFVNTYALKAYDKIIPANDRLRERCIRSQLTLERYPIELNRGGLRQMENVPQHLLAHLSPLGWEHINLTGDYIWVARQDASENHNGLRPLRIPPETFKKAE